VNDDLANRILNGTVIVKRNVKEFTADGHGVIFDDDSQIDHIDCVLMATGFNIVFPYIDEEILPVKENRVRQIKLSENKDVFFFYCFRFDFINIFGHLI
jgi:dimethylaniline monooxygenase (N-oxide forming)